MKSDRLKFLSWVCGWYYSSTVGFAFLLEIVSIGFISILLGILAEVISVGSWEPVTSLASSTVEWLPHDLLWNLSNENASSSSVTSLLSEIEVCFYFLFSYI